MAGLLHKQPKATAPVIGIDLGHTSICTAVFVNGRMEIIPNEHDQRTTLTLLTVSSEGEVLVGETGIYESMMHPENAMLGVVLLPLLSQQPYDAETVLLGDRWFSPRDLLAELLGSLKRNSERHLGVPVQHAVISVPVCFDDIASSAVRSAAASAGLEVLRIIREPSAAIIAHHLVRNSRNSSVLVFHMGGESLAVSALTVDSGLMEVLATRTSYHASGRMLDRRLEEHIFSQVHGIAGISRHRIAVETERVKRSLSAQMTARWEIDDISAPVSRAKYEHITGDIFAASLLLVDTVLLEAGLERSTVDHIVLTGGCSRTPYLQSMLTEHFNRTPMSLHPDEVAAYGAALKGDELLSPERYEPCIMFHPLVTLSLGVEIAGAAMRRVIQRNNLIPTKKRAVFRAIGDVAVRIYEGQRAMVKDNIYRGQLLLPGSAAEHDREVDVIVEIDVLEQLTVIARDQASGQIEKLSMDLNHLSPEALETLTNEAYEQEEADKLTLDRITSRNDLQYCIDHLQLLDVGDEHLQDRNLLLAEASHWLQAHHDAAPVEHFKNRRVELQRALMSMRLGGQQQAGSVEEYRHVMTTAREVLLQPLPQSKYIGSPVQ